MKKIGYIIINHVSMKKINKLCNLQMIINALYLDCKAVISYKRTESYCNP